MTKPDSEAERERLAKYYASITPEELQQLAEDAWSLTDAAREALKAELSRRGLAAELRQSPPANQPLPGIVAIRQFRDLPAALLAQSVLDSAEIDSFLQDENTIRLNWLWSNALGGIRLLVREEDAADAARLLVQKPAQTLRDDLRRIQAAALSHLRLDRHFVRSQGEEPILCNGRNRGAAAGQASRLEVQLLRPRVEREAGALGRTQRQPRISVRQRRYGLGSLGSTLRNA
jgi:hypothetical protein